MIVLHTFSREIDSKTPNGHHGHSYHRCTARKTHQIPTFLAKQPAGASFCKGIFASAGRSLKFTFWLDFIRDRPKIEKLAERVIVTVRVMGGEKSMTEPPKTRASLILRLRHSDDQVAWSEFVEIYQPLIFRLARRKGLQEADALDLTQDVMTRVAKAIRQFDPHGAGTFRGWISRITRNLAIDFLRSKHRRQVTADDSSIRQMIENTPSIEDSRWFDVEHRRQVFAWAAGKIKHEFQDSTWNAFWETAVQQVPVKQVAESMGLSPGAVYIARSRVIAKLKQKVNQHLDGSSFTANVDQFGASTGDPS